MSLIKLVGDKELERELNKLEGKMIRRVIKPAIRTGLTPIQKQAKANVPVEDGFLREEIKKHVGKKGTWGRVYVDSATYAGADGKRKNPNKYAHLVEFGTKHKAPRPFLRTAREAKQGEALQRMANSARKKKAHAARPTRPSVQRVTKPAQTGPLPRETLQPGPTAQTCGNRSCLNMPTRAF